MEETCYVEGFKVLKESLSLQEFAYPMEEEWCQEAEKYAGRLYVIDKILQFQWRVYHTRVHIELTGFCGHSTTLEFCRNRIYSHYGITYSTELGVNSPRPCHIVTYQCIQHNPDQALDIIVQSTQVLFVMMCQLLTKFR